MVLTADQAGNAGIRRYFTLIELVVAISIILLTVALVMAVFRKDSPAQQLNRAEIDFKAYCARVRYRACESGKDWVVKYDLERKAFAAYPGKYEKFIMPGDDGGKEAQISDDAEPQGDAEEDDEDESLRQSGFSRLEWKLPENFEFSTEDASEDSLMSGEKLEVFRFFPDGGASGSGNLEFKCDNLSRIFRITRLTGRVSAIDKEEYERGKLE